MDYESNRAEIFHTFGDDPRRIEAIASRYSGCPEYGFNVKGAAAAAPRSITSEVCRPHFHLMVQPTGLVVLISGSSPESTASIALRK